MRWIPSPRNGWKLFEVKQSLPQVVWERLEAIKSLPEIDSKRLEASKTLLEALWKRLEAILLASGSSLEAIGSDPIAPKSDCEQMEATHALPEAIGSDWPGAMESDWK